MVQEGLGYGHGGALDRNCALLSQVNKADAFVEVRVFVRPFFRELYRPRPQKHVTTTLRHRETMLHFQKVEGLLNWV